MDTDASALTLYTFFSPEIEDFLLNNGIDIPFQLHENGVEVRTQVCSDPAQSGTKGAVTAILASAAVMAVAIPAVTQILEHYLNRPIKVTELVPVAVADADGAPAFHPDGAPRYMWVERTHVVQPEPHHANTKVKLGFLGFKFEYATDSRK